MAGRHFGNTAMVRRPGPPSSAHRPSWALGCSVAVHASILATILVTLYRPALITTPEAEPIAVIFEAPRPAQSQPELSPSPDPGLSSMEPASATNPPLVETVPTEETAAPVQSTEPESMPLPPLASSSAPPAVMAPPPSLLTAPSLPSEPPTLGSTPPSVIAPIAPTRTEAVIQAQLPLLPSRPKPPRTLSRVARPALAPRSAAPPAGTPSSFQPLTSTLAAPQQAAPAVPAPAGQAQTEVSAGWRSALANWLQSHRTYPDEARRRAEEGTVLVRFSVARDGHVLDVTIVRSSGSQALDEAAQATFRNARMPPFTADMSQVQTTVTVPIRYRLER